MGSLLTRATKDKIKKPHKVVIFGTDGVGKTSWAAGAPNPIVIGTEDGSARYGATETPVARTFTEITDTMKELIEKRGAGYETLVVDAVDGIEALAEEDVMRKNKYASIEDPGYGKGYKMVEETFSEFVFLCDKVRDAGMNVILIGHSHVKTVNDPAMPAAYDRHQLKLREKNAAKIREWADSVLFATYEVFVKTDSVKSIKGKAFGDGKRVVYTERRPAYDAKNRDGLPHVMELSWAAYESALNRPGPEIAQGLIIESMQTIALVKDEELASLMKRSVIDAGNNVERLREILNRIKVRTEQE